MDGAAIRAARERRGWTQAQLAERLGVGYKTIGNWENGHTVPKNRLGMLRDLFGAELEAAERDFDHPLRNYSEIALLAELMRRAGERNAVAAQPSK